MRFVLVTPIQLSNRDCDTIPKGATGSLSRDAVGYHELTFDHHYDSPLLSQMDSILVLDEHDDTELLAAIQPLRVPTPSLGARMTRIAAAAPAFIFGYLNPRS